MGSLQLIDADSDRVRRLTLLLEDRGWRVHSSSCALAALTAIEWNRPEVVLIHADPVGITAIELCTTIKYDSTIEGVRVVLYSAPPIGERARKTFDQTIASDRPEVIAASFSRVDSSSAPNHRDAKRNSRTPRDRLPREADGLRLDDVIESVTDAMLTGRLMIGLRRSTTTHAIVFDRGKIIHAKFGEEVGIDALRQLVRAGERGDLLWYQFEKLQSRVGGREMRSMDLSRILELAVPGDEYGTQQVDPAALARQRRS